MAVGSGWASFGSGVACRVATVLTVLVRGLLLLAWLTPRPSAAAAQPTRAALGVGGRNGTAGEVRERRAQLRHPAYAKPELLATGPNELWSWDISKLKGPAKWTYYYLYVLLDVFSRYVPGWMVATAESAALAERLIADSVEKQGVTAGTLTVHADLARVEGVRVETIRMTFLLLVALAVALAIKIVGLLPISALLIIPPATVRRFAATPEGMAGLAALLGAVSVVAGLWGSLLWDTPSGPSIVVAATLAFVIARMWPEFNAVRR